MAQRRPSPPNRYQATSLPPSVGAYGEVEVWQDSLLNRPVAIKWLLAAEGEEQFLAEWRVLAAVVPRHIVEIYDLIFDDHGVLFGIVMEYVDGQPLSAVKVPRKASETDSIIRLLYQFAKGLEDLHSIGFVHRDVKPENAVISNAGRLKVCDFGLSGPENHMTERGRGTMGYRGPEYFHKKKEFSVTAKSDVYAFGVVCWKLFTGGVPDVGHLGFPDEDSFPVDSVGTKLTLPERLVEAIDSCLVWVPEDRPPM